MLPKNILYIHGFNSSPLSIKAEQTRGYLARNFPEVRYYCPQVISNPRQAITQLESIINQFPDESWAIVGSSLGGYYAHYLASKYTCKAVLINPAVKPYELLIDYMGTQTNPYTEEVYQVEEAFIAALIDIESLKIVKNHYMVMVQTGDEVLDYQQAVEKYEGCDLIVENGGDHSFVDYDKKLPRIIRFLNESVS